MERGEGRRGERERRVTTSVQSLRKLGSRMALSEGRRDGLCHLDCSAAQPSRESCLCLKSRTK
jgi:hypothetical protein